MRYIYIMVLIFSTTTIAYAENICPPDIKAKIESNAYTSYQKDQLRDICSKQKYKECPKDFIDIIEGDFVTREHKEYVASLCKGKEVMISEGIDDVMDWRDRSQWGGFVLYTMQSRNYVILAQDHGCDLFNMNKGDVITLKAKAKGFGRGGKSVIYEFSDGHCAK